MAVDSVRDRASVIDVEVVLSCGPRPNPDDAQENRQWVCCVYQGLLASAPTGRSTYNSHQWGRGLQGRRMFVIRSASGTVRVGS